MILQLKKALRSHIKPGKASLLERFFKTGKSEYAEGDKFIGVMVPDTRKVAKQFKNLSISNIQKLLYSNIHEERLVSLFILTHRYENGDEKTKKEVYDFYLKHRAQVNNWDLVDLTSHKIVGDYLLDKDKSVLYRLTKAKSLWDRRIAIISTFAFIRKKDFEDCLKIAELLVNDSHDLIHKAVGWMLREIGKKDQAIEEKFLKKHYKTMPRTMLRYAIARFDAPKRSHYML